MEEKKQRGGRREGAGRKKGVSVGPYNSGGQLLTHTDTFRVSASTHKRIRQLRELTKDDTMPLNRMFEAWIAELAEDYGIE